MQGYQFLHMTLKYVVWPTCFLKCKEHKKREVICIMFVWCILLFISNSMSNQWTFILYLSWHIYHTQSQLNNETRLHEIICRSSFCYFLKGQWWFKTANLNVINFNPFKNACCNRFTYLCNNELNTYKTLKVCHL